MAAPIRIRTDIATVTDRTAIEALILDFEQSAEARKLRKPAKSEPTPSDVLAWYESQRRRIDSVLERDFGPAVYRTLRADLATWPAPFQRRVGELLFGESRRPWNNEPGSLWRRFEEGRQIGAGEEYSDRGCGCGCRGFNDRFLWHLRQIRRASAEAREARAKAVHAPRSKAVLLRRREVIAEHKGELLELLWLHGQRRIDRARLREHAAEHYSADLARTRNWIAKAPAEIRECRARLRENRTYDRRGPTDRPLTPQRRLEFERSITETKRRIPEWRARVAELEALLANPSVCARAWSGCERAIEEATA